MERNGRMESYLIVNRVEVLDAAGCSACGREFSGEPAGEKTLVLSIGSNNERTYFFCGGCGDNIVGRAESELAKKRYIWDWAVPLRASGQNAHQIAQAA
jgi:predicted RNA-binding Zn-ribbon protein involved in translation (DUF1610 family)